MSISSAMPLWHFVCCHRPGAAGLYQLRTNKLSDFCLPGGASELAEADWSLIYTET